MQRKGAQGGGIETHELLRRGWTVVAVDQNTAAIDDLRRSTSPAERMRLTLICASFADAEFPPVDLVWAGLSLPSCHPQDFAGVWAKGGAALRPGGRLAGDLFGVRNAWHTNPELTFVDRDRVQALLAGFEIEHLDEAEEERQTVFQGVQHWHGFTLVARKL